jgi:hypothetical protein
MEVAEKFLEATTCRSVSVGSLEVDRKYPVISARCSDTKYVATVLMTIRGSPSHTIKVFLPKHYGAVITDANLEIINSQEHPLNLIFKRKCINANSYAFAIEAYPT